MLEVRLLVHHRLRLRLRIVLLRLSRTMAMTNPMVIAIATLHILSALCMIVHSRFSFQYLLLDGS
jgi:hypothetical protein